MSVTREEMEQYVKAEVMDALRELSHRSREWAGGSFFPSESPTFSMVQYNTEYFVGNIKCGRRS